MIDKLTIRDNVVINIRVGGEIIGQRVGHNVWTNAGREYSALVKTYKIDGQIGMRSDRISYVGMGSGTQPETVNVNSIVAPVVFQGNEWLKKIEHDFTTFPDPANRFVVRYKTVFASEDFSDNPYLTECGLFTDGHQNSKIAGNRVTVLAEAPLQTPIAYHTFQPIPKTSSMELEIIWELRH